MPIALVFVKQCLLMCGGQPGTPELGTHLLIWYKNNIILDI